MNVTFFLALRHLPLAEAMSLFMLAPLMVCLLAVPLLGETIGKHRVLSVVIGIIGALILLRPRWSLVSARRLLALLATLGYAFYLMLTRMLARLGLGCNDNSLHRHCRLCRLRNSCPLQLASHRATTHRLRLSARSSSHRRPRLDYYRLYHCSCIGWRLCLIMLHSFGVHSLA